MTTLAEQVEEFLAQKRIAVAGVSRDRSQPANAIYRKLRDTGHEVFATNPKTQKVDGAVCYPDLVSIPGGVDAVMIATPPAASEKIVRQCSELGISRVWMHRSFGAGSVSQAAVDYCREHGISVIPGGCPMMFDEPVDCPGPPPPTPQRYTSTRTEACSIGSAPPCRQSDAGLERLSMRGAQGGWPRALGSCGVEAAAHATAAISTTGISPRSTTPGFSKAIDRVGGDG